MSGPRSVDIIRTHDYSGLPGYENLELPLYAAVTSHPGDQWDYYYAELYRDGTLRLRSNVNTLTEPVDTILEYNPWTSRGYWSDTFAGEHPEWLVKRAQDLLKATGVPSSAFDEPTSTTERGNLDPHAGKVRGSAERFTDQALNALQFSRWANYDRDEIEYPNMDRVSYAQALGALSARFGDAVLADSTRHTITNHLSALHTDLHTPGLVHKPHSDGSPRNEKYMEVAHAVIRERHPLLGNMRDFGLWVNFLSLFGDSDFWAVTREYHPTVFNAAADHLQDLGPAFAQQHSMYVRKGTINPVRLMAEYFPGAYGQIIAERPDFVPLPDSPPAVSVESLD
jgi:hypothetical protein